MRFSIEVSIGLDLRDLRKDDRPGVRAGDVDGMWDGRGAEEDVSRGLDSIVNMVNRS
jgi:hypothetical protein